MTSYSKSLVAKAKAREDSLVELERTLGEEKKADMKMAKLEGMEEAANIKRAALVQGQINAELKTANIVCMQVRRAALRKLLQQDHNQYEAELNRLGKAFHVERI